MQTLRAFMKGETKQKENVKVVVSDRFQDENGNPIEWEIRLIPSKEDEEIRRSCTRKVTGQKKGKTEEFDSNKYVLKIACAATVYPDLKNKELQDSYGVFDEVSLLQELLFAGELNAYLDMVEKINGYTKTLSEKVDEIKN